MAENEQPKDYVVEFLMAEYNVISQDFSRLRNEGLNRLNFLITLTSGFIGGLVLLSQTTSASDTSIRLISIGSLVFLMIVGLDTFRFAVQRGISTDRDVRALGRIRRYFVGQDPSLAKHLTWQTHDEPTRWITRNISGIRRTVQSILSLLSALFISLTASLLSDDFGLLAAVGLASFVIVFSSLSSYTNWRYKRASGAAFKSVRFPKSENQSEPN